MPPEKPITLDCTKENAILQLVPHQPLLASQKTGWHGIHLEHHRQPAHSTPKHCSKQHIISIPLGRSTWLEREENGCFHTEQIVRGDVGIYPAKRYNRVEL